MQSSLWDMGSWCLHCMWGPRGGWACSRPGAASRGATAPKWRDTCAAHVSCKMARIRCECAVEHSAETARARSSRPAGSATQAQLVHIAKAYWARSTSPRGSSARAVESLQSAEIARRSFAPRRSQAAEAGLGSLAGRASFSAMDCGTALSSGYVTDRVLFYNFQILFKQTSIIAPDIYKHVSVLPSQKHNQWDPTDCGTTGYTYPGG